MTLHLQNVATAESKLNTYDVSEFVNVSESFLYFTKHLYINSFRHLENVELNFRHPVTVISGNNRIGKTSILLLLACSHENFQKLDSTSPTPTLKEHTWSDVLSFTLHETVNNDYSYILKWRHGGSTHEGEGKRLASSRAWSGLAKKSSDPKRINAKIRGREVRFIDLERILPSRSFSNALYRKANTANKIRLAEDIEKAFSYIFGSSNVKIYEVGGHINKSCFLISYEGMGYSTFNAASGEESLICMLKEIIQSSVNSLILIDEVEAGFHPSVQRKLADFIKYISWRDKKQFILTTHSPSFLSSFNTKSRLFLEKSSSGYKTIQDISHQAAASKMDSVGYPLIILYCEDDLAKFLIKSVLVEMSEDHAHFDRLANIVSSGPIDQVRNDYERHKRNFSQLRNKVGFCAVFDGDHKDVSPYSNYFENDNEYAGFLYPYEAPEKFLVKSYLRLHPNVPLQSAFDYGDHHSLFSKMENLGLATDEADARSRCYVAFTQSTEYSKHKSDLKKLLTKTMLHFSSRVEGST